MSEYWEECIEIAFEEYGIVATKEQIKQVAGDVEVSHENYGMAHGHYAIPNPLSIEIKRLEKALVDEKKEYHCHICIGRGYVIYFHAEKKVTEPCWNCRSKGRLERR